MPDDIDVVVNKPKNMYTTICIVQAVFVTVILIVVLIIKFFFKSGYQEFKVWYNENVLEETVITATFSEAK